MPCPEPGEFDHGGPQARISCLGYALLAVNRATLPGCWCQTGIRGHLPAIFEMAEKAFGIERIGKFWTYPSQGHKHRHLRGYRIALLPWCDQSVAIGLDCLDLVDEKFEQIQFAADLRPEVLRQLAPVAGPQFVEPCAAIPPQRLVAGNPLREQQALDAVDVFGALADQRLALAADPASVLLLGCRHPHHRANPRLATLVGQKRAHQRLAVNLIGLGAASAPRGGNRGGIDDPTLDVFGDQRTVNPETIQASLLDGDNPKVLARPRTRLLRQRRKALQQPRYIARPHRMLRQLLAATR